LEAPQLLDACPHEVVGIRLAPATKLLMQSPASNFFKCFSSTIILLSAEKNPPQGWKTLAFFLKNYQLGREQNMGRTMYLLKIYTLF